MSPRTRGGADVYRRALADVKGLEEFFTEFRLQTDGDSSEIPYGAPTLLVLGNDPGVIYHLTVARDLVQFFRAADLPVLFIKLEPDLPHTFRFELYPDWYAFYIDAHLIDAGVPVGPFTTHNPRISWRGRSWSLPCENAWDYIRYGELPEDASGDYDSDGSVSLFDFYFAQECLANERPGINGGPEMDAGPGCRFADFDADADTDLADFAEFQNVFGGSHP